MKTILLFTLVILAVAISGCQDKKKVRNTNTQKETVKVETKAVLIKDTTQVMETKTATATTVVKEAPEYLLVGGCFRIKDNADRMLNSLLVEGFPAFIIYEDDYYKVQVGAFRQLSNAIKMEQKLRKFRYIVAYEGYKTEKEAITAVRKIHKIPGKEETWIYQIK